MRPRIYSIHQMLEKQVTYHTTKSYCTLNTRTERTKNIWLVFHGIGYLSRYFLRHFENLSKEENYIIAPQAPSKYYLNSDYKHIGASWLTKENTAQEIDNLQAYINAVCISENIGDAENLIVLGFSQGVSIATRWIARNKVFCAKLVLYAGTIPVELKSEDFEYLWEYSNEVIAIVGHTDPYLTQERLSNQIKKIETLFHTTPRLIQFDGGHEMKPDVIHTIIE